MRITEKLGCIGQELGVWEEGEMFGQYLGKTMALEVLVLSFFNFKALGRSFNSSEFQFSHWLVKKLHKALS